MTTIAYSHENKEVAFDGRVTVDSLILTDKANKMTIVDDVRFFFCGTCSDQDLFIHYYFGKELHNKRPDCWAIVFDGGIFYSVSVDDDCKLHKYKMKESTAIGSGRDFAMSAMDFGRNAKDAVKYAATRDVYTGGKISVFKSINKVKK